MFLSIAKTILSILAAYLVGSLPTAYVMGRLYKRIDIREYGSGNVGATNAFRILGKVPGCIVLAIDVFKGWICPVVIADFFGQTSLAARVILSIVAVAGHNWTIFLGFKGGKGMATSLGVLIGLATKITVLRPVLLWCVAIWTVSFLLSGFVSLSSLLAAVCLPFLMVIFSAPLGLVILGIVFCALIVLRHKPNISRLIKGEESQVPLAFFKRKRYP